MKFLRNFVSAFLGGFSVSLGCGAYYLFKDTNDIIASLMFAVGFLVVTVFNLGLFTDKAGHLFDSGKVETNLKTLLTSLLGNIFGSLLCGLFSINKLHDTVNSIISEKITSLNIVELFIGSFLCGVLIYIGLHGFRKAGSGFTGSIMLIGSTTLIGLCGFEYSLFNVFLTGAGITSYSNNLFPILTLWLVSAVGNALGAILFAYLCKFKDSDDHSRRHKHRHHKSESKKEEENIEKTGV